MAHLLEVDVDAPGGYQVLEQQVDAEAAHLAMPSGEHIVSYIAGNAAFEGLGSVKARRLWERFGERLYGLLDTGDASIRAGRWPALSDDETAPIAFLPCEERLMADLVVDLYALDPVNTQVLAPLRNSLAGTKNLNLRCQERFTKGAPSVSRWNVEFNQPELCGLNLGDVVLCTRNLWDKGLQNGSLGRVVEVEPASAQLPTEDEPVLAWVDWDDGVRRALTTDMLEDVELGYAVTVHKAQGSQWPRVIVPLTDSRLLDRTLVYTAVTRAQRQVILVGDAEAARRAVQAPPRVHTRKVALDLALKRYMAAPELA